MFRNYVVTAFRNLERNRLYAGISILGLAVAFATAMLLAQFVRGELSYDHWVPGYERIFKVASTIVQPGEPPTSVDLGQTALANQIRAAFPQAEAIARLYEASPPVKARPNDMPNADHAFAWVDPDIFKVFPMPVLAGDLGSALQQPDTVVITRNMARHYFHRDLPIGDTLLVQVATPPPAGNRPIPWIVAWRPMRVTAVLKDLPANTNLVTEVFASSRSSYSALALADAGPPTFGTTTYTFVRLGRGGSPADLQRALDIATKPEMAFAAHSSAGAQWLYHGVPIGEAHLTLAGQTTVATKPTGSRAVAYGGVAVSVVLVLVASINFVTLMTARAARRAVEVGVRKSVGAARVDLMVQFVGEALLQVVVATTIAAALAEVLIKPFSALVHRELALDFGQDHVLLCGIAGAALVIGLLASAYPAIILSSFRPAAVLKGGPIRAGGSPAARTFLVMVQFAILVGFIATTITIYRQTEFALAEGIGATDSNLLIAVVAPCQSAFHEEVRKLPGVAATACSSYSALNMPNGKSLNTVQLAGGRKTTFSNAPVGFGFFELYGVKPLAGRLFQRDHGEDGVLADPNATSQPTVVINEAAVRALGFSDPRTAIGKSLYWSGGRPHPLDITVPPIAPSKIIGVVPDMPMNVRAPTDPSFFFVAPVFSYFINIRLNGHDVPGTVRAIAATWKRTNDSQPLEEHLLSQMQATLYQDLVIQRATLVIGAGLSVLIACLGLFALSAFITERRTKEIGVRKAMGAGTRDVVLLLLWQFSIPILIAAAVAAPLGALAMGWWLHGFAYHVALSAWTFVLAALAALGIAWLTVFYQSFTVARAKPVNALRYE